MMTMNINQLFRLVARQRPIIHFMIFPKLTFWPWMRMPIRYTLPATQTIPMDELSRMSMEMICCHQLISKGILDIITTGEVSGIIDAQTARPELGCSMVVTIMTMEMIMGMEIGNIRVWTSPSSVAAAPMAANCDA